MPLFATAVQRRRCCFNLGFHLFLPGNGFLVRRRSASTPKKEKPGIRKTTTTTTTPKKHDDLQWQRCIEGHNGLLQFIFKIIAYPYVVMGHMMRTTFIVRCLKQIQSTMVITCAVHDVLSIKTKKFWQSKENHKEKSTKKSQQTTKPPNHTKPHQITPNHQQTTLPNPMLIRPNSNQMSLAILMW